MFCKKTGLKNFAKFTGKYLCQSFFLNKVAGLLAILIIDSRTGAEQLPLRLLRKKETLAQVFSCEFYETFKNIFLQNTSGRLLLVLHHCVIQRQPPKVFYEKGTLKSFAKFTGKRLYQSVFSR